MGQSMVADEVVFKDRALGDGVAKSLNKPAGKFLPPPKFTEAELEKVTKLDLGKSKITDEGLKEVAKLQNLRLLDLDGTKVTKAGVAELKKALPNCSISGP